MGPVPPNELDAEAAVLCAMISSTEALSRARTVLPAADFYADANRHIFEAVIAVAARGRAVDVVTVSAELRAQNRIAQIGGATYLAQLADATPAVANVDTHVALIRDAARKRAAINIGRKLQAEGANGVRDVAAWLTGVQAEIQQLAPQPQRPSPFAPLGPAEIFASLPSIPYVIRALDLCPGAPAMWAGFGFSRKTIAAQSAALAIAAGLGKVWGCFGAPRGRVIHFDYEQGDRLTRERYQRLAMALMVGPDDLGDRLSLVSMPKLFIDAPSAEDELTRAVAGHQLAIVDSLRAAAPSLDENSSEVRCVLDLLGRVSSATDCAFVVIHHARKPNATQQGGAKMAIRGSGALFDACGSVLVFEAEKGQPTRVTHEKARASGTLTDDFELTTEDVPDGPNPRAGLVVTASGAPSRPEQAEQAEHARSAARLKKVKQALTELFMREPEQPGLTVLAAKLGRNKQVTGQALALLVDAGHVQQVGSTRTRRYKWFGTESIHSVPGFGSRP